MAYDREKIFEQAKQVIVDKKLYFIEDIAALLPCSKSTFYDFFKVDSNELNTIKDLLEQNRVVTKVSMRSKWYESENATLQVALMKMIATDDEAHRLNGTKTENKSNVTLDNFSIKDVIRFEE